MTMKLTRLRGAMLLAFTALALCPTPAIAQAAANKYGGQDVNLRSAVTGQTIGDDAHRPLYVDTVVLTTSTDRGGTFGTSAATLMAANASRRGFAIQNQSASSDCYISGQGTATADYHSLKIAAGTYYETPSTHVGTTAVSVICTGASTPLYVREW